MVSITWNRGGSACGDPHPSFYYIIRHSREVILLEHMFNTKKHAYAWIKKKLIQNKAKQQQVLEDKSKEKHTVFQVTTSLKCPILAALPARKNLLIVNLSRMQLHTEKQMTGLQSGSVSFFFLEELWKRKQVWQCVYKQRILDTCRAGKDTSLTENWWNDRNIEEPHETGTCVACRMIV